MRKENGTRTTVSCKNVCHREAFLRLPYSYGIFTTHMTFFKTQFGIFIHICSERMEDPISWREKRNGLVSRDVSGIRHSLLRKPLNISFPSPLHSINLSSAAVIWMHVEIHLCLGLFFWVCVCLFLNSDEPFRVGTKEYVFQHFSLNFSPCFIVVIYCLVYVRLPLHYSQS